MLLVSAVMRATCVSLNVFRIAPAGLAPVSAFRLSAETDQPGTANMTAVNGEVNSDFLVRIDVI